MALFGLWVADTIVSNAIIGSVPEAHLMSTIGLLALVANVSVATLSASAASPGSGRNPIGSLQKCLHLLPREEAIV
jgi:hypothetical protein